MLAIYTGLVWVNLIDIQNIDHVTKAYTHENPKDPDNPFVTYLIKNGKIGVPAGNMKKLLTVFPNITIEDKRIAPKFASKKTSKLTLRDYQTAAMTEILEYIKQGGTSFNLAGSPGCGKSFMLSNLLAKLNTKTLIIANQKMLINQLSEEIEKTLGESPTVLNAKNTKLGDINVATSQFISSNPEVWYQIKSEVGCIVLDEAEALASPTVTKIFQRSPAKYKIFISATFSRSVDNRTEALVDFAGHKKIVLQSTSLLTPTVIGVHCEEEFFAPKNPKMYTTAKNTFYQNSNIDSKVIAITKFSISKNRQVLIASDIGSAQERLCTKLNNIGIPTAILSAKTKDVDRVKILEDYDAGRIKVLIGFGVLNAGLSIPKITTIIRHSTPASKEKLEQLIGRGRRMFDGKEGCWVIDLVFNGFNNQVRSTLYAIKARTENWIVKHTSWDAFKQTLNK